MSWLDKIAKKRLAELEEHPELMNRIIRKTEFYYLLYQ